MVLLRRIALAGLLLGAGCNQSLFDEHVDEGGTADAAVAGGADASTLCPEPCVGDAVGDFSATTQGPVWGYRTDLRDDTGTKYADLMAGDIAVDLNGWLTNASTVSGIASCKAVPSAPGCAGLADHLLFLPAPKTAGTDPTLSFTVPSDGVYRVSGSYRLPDGVPAGAQTYVELARNARRDYVYLDALVPAVAPQTFDLDVEAAAGDRLLLTVAPAASGTPAALGVQMYVSRSATGLPGQCQAGASFDGIDEPAQLKDHCLGSAWTNAGTTSVPGASPELGSARSLAYGTHLHGPTPLDRTGDFTIQFWFKDQAVPASELVRPEPIFADDDCGAPGFWLTVYDDGGPNNWNLRTYDTTDWCNSDHHLPDITWTQDVEFDTWHFLRIVRSTAEGTLRMCVDGKPVGTAVDVPASLDLTSAVGPYLGAEGPDGGPGLASGIIDDFRAFKRALPCEGP
jgi:hypothetical protein